MARSSKENALIGLTIGTLITMGILSIAGIVIGALCLAGGLALDVGLTFFYAGFADVLTIFGIVGIFDTHLLPVGIPALLLGITLTLVCFLAPPVAALITLVAFSALFFVLAAALLPPLFITMELPPAGVDKKSMDKEVSPQTTSSLSPVPEVVLTPQTNHYSTELFPASSEKKSDSTAQFTHTAA